MPQDINNGDEDLPKSSHTVILYDVDSYEIEAWAATIGVKFTHREYLGIRSRMRGTLTTHYDWGHEYTFKNEADAVWFKLRWQ